MADTTVKQLAEIVGTPVDRLLQQMQEAGLPQKEEAMQLMRHKKSPPLLKRRMENPRAGQKDHA